MAGQTNVAIESPVSLAQGTLMGRKRSLFRPLPRQQKVGDSGHDVLNQIVANDGQHGPGMFAQSHPCQHETSAVIVQTKAEKHRRRLSVTELEPSSKPPAGRKGRYADGYDCHADERQIVSIRATHDIRQ
jgi:hypothetical protein